MQKIQLESATKLASTLPGILNIGLAIGIGWVCAQLLWLAIDRSEEHWLPRPTPEFQGQSSVSTAEDIKKLAAANLFGKIQTTSKPKPKSKPRALPATSLNLKLVGVLAFGESDRSRALIRSGNQTPEPYGLKAEVPGGATVNEILPDRVVLDRNGRYETLMLEKSTPSSSGSNSRVATYNRSGRSSGFNSSSGSGNTDLGAIREEILLDPSKASQYVRVQPARSGNQLRGYRVYPGRNRAAFKNVGLRAGDLVTAVNGVQLNDPAKSLQLLGDLSQANSVSLTVERGGKPRNVTLSIN